MMKSVIKKYFLATLVFLAGIIQLQAQNTLTGNVINSKNEPIASASIRIKELKMGVNTDTSGNFSLLINEKGKLTLQVSSVGYSKKEIEFFSGDSAIHLDILLNDEPKNLGEIVLISAGSFEASDKAKGASLTPMDAVTVAGNGGDIANALRSLPGAQQIGEKEGLFVRGGTGEETKQFVDGTLLKNPNYSNIPGVPQPARLNPFLFKGILFSSGGYSALYGQALSSALILETVDLPDQSSAGLHIFPQHLGAGLQQLAKNQKSSYGFNVGYGNLHLYNKVVPQNLDFFHGPEYLSADANFRIKTSKTGMLKFYTNYGYSHVGMRNPDIDSTELFSSYNVQGTNFYSNLSYHETLGNNWKINAGISYNYSKENINNKLLNNTYKQVFLSAYPYNEKNKDVHTHSDFAQGRVVMTKRFTHNQAFRFGAEYFYTNDKYNNNDIQTNLKDGLSATFAEVDIYIARNIAAKVGVRTEHSSLLNRINLAPRISLAYRLNDDGQINLAYGVFYQKPENIYLSETENLAFTKAQHYIINYQKKAHNRLFRAEAFYKKYNRLVVTTPEINIGGDGYAKGIELFWRDKKTFKDFDYWISYSYLDTKRRFLDYPNALQPNFTTPHTASIALKRYFQEINFSANLSYTVATGRPYYHIQTNATGKPFISEKGRTNMYNGMNLSFAYLFSIFPKWKNKDFSGIGFGMNNVFGTRQVFGYKYSYDGRNKTAITQPSARSYYIGLFMSFGIDRRDDFINENL